MTAFDNGGPAYQITANNSVYASGMSLWDAAALCDPRQLRVAYGRRWMAT